MSQNVMQHSFHAGEWAPALNARVDVAKYKSGAALLRNFYPDYRGGASTRPGTIYCLQCYKSAFPVRLIRFQVNSFTNFVLEFGQNYIRPFFNGSPTLETGLNITGVTKASTCVVTVTNSYVVGEWVFISGVGGMTQLNGRYFSIIARSAGSISLGDLNGNAIDSTAFSNFTTGGTTQRVYTIPSPYVASDLALLKFAQNINTLILCHPSYSPTLLTIISSTNWTLSTINFSATIGTPTGVTVATTLGAGGANYSYVVTAVDIDGQESPASNPATLLAKLDLRSTAGTNTVAWTAVAGAVSYNVYRAQISFVTIPAGSEYGFVGNCTGTSLIDSNIAADFTSGPPVVRNPFVGAPVQSVTVTAGGAYTTTPTLTIAAPSSGIQATGQSLLRARTITSINPSSFGTVGDVYTVTFWDGTGSGGHGVFGPVVCNIQVDTTSPGNPGTITGAHIVPGTAVSFNPIPTLQVANANWGDGSIPRFAGTIDWEVAAINLTSGGSGYTAVPAVTFSAGAAAATAVLGTASAGNPSVPAYYQQRLVLAGPIGNPEQFDMSSTGSYYNFNIHNPVEADDAIEGVLVSISLQSIKSMLPMSTGLIVLSDQSAWLLNGGQNSTAVSPAAIVANQHSYNGASDVPPIVSNFDVLYVQAKGSIVRDLTFNFYASIYTGTDISILSSHLFYGFTIKEWAFAEEPFKVIWAVRNDGILLSLTYLKEQDIVGWSHSDSPQGSGLFKSVCAVTEARPTTDGRAIADKVDATYFVVQRTVNGSTIQYIERLAERNFIDPATEQSDKKYAWCVDSGLQYFGAPITTVSGLFHLIGMQVVGLADGAVVGPLTVSASGTVTLVTPASLITLGLAFTPQLQTLQLDIGEPTIQGKRKKITAVTVRVQDALNLLIGKSFSSLVSMKDLILGNVGTMSNAVVTNLVTGDARTLIDPSWDVPGQYCIQQSDPLPATVLGVIPEIVVGDTGNGRG